MAPCPGSLDANIILRLLLRDIPDQSDAAMKLLRKPGVFHVADTALIEVVFALERYYEIPRPEIVHFLQAILFHPKMTINRSLFSKAFSVYPSHPKLSFEDCCLATYAKLNNALPLWTFDKKLAGQMKEEVSLL